jgi:SAM-dependent methyltransferase
MGLTGERPMTGRTPASLLALHAAGYREVRERLGAGVVVDVGCGEGDGTATLCRADGHVVGIDRDVGTVAVAGRRHPGVVTIAGDAVRLPFATGSVDWVCSSHLIEHFSAPERHVVEVARVLGPDATAFFVTPNAPADFENPYHLHLFETPELAALLGRHFGDVKVWGLDGDAVVKADFEQRRRWARRVLRLDVFDLRHRLPRRWYVGLHAGARAATYPFLAARTAAPMTDDRFSLTTAIDRTTLVLFAVARCPRRA